MYAVLRVVRTALVVHFSRSVGAPRRHLATAAVLVDRDALGDGAQPLLGFEGDAGLQGAGNRFLDDVFGVAVRDGRTPLLTRRMTWVSPPAPP